MTFCLKYGKETTFMCGAESQTRQTRQKEEEGVGDEHVIRVPGHGGDGGDGGEGELKPEGDD